MSPHVLVSGDKLILSVQGEDVSITVRQRLDGALFVLFPSYIRMEKRLYVQDEIKELTIIDFQPAKI